MHEPPGALLVTVQDGDGGEFARYLRAQVGSWQQFSRFGDKVVQATFMDDGDLLLISRQQAPRGKILRLDGKSLDVGNAKVLIQQAADTVETSFYHSPPSLVATDSRIFVLYQMGGPSELRVFDHQGNPTSKPQQLPVSTVGDCLLRRETRSCLPIRHSSTQRHIFALTHARIKRSKQT